MKKVFFIMSTDDFSGAEAVNFSIIENLNKNFDFYWVSRKGKIESYLKERNIKFIPITSLSPKEIRRVVRENKPDILHATDYRASCICSLANVNVPIISHLHNNPPWIKSYFNPQTLFYLICSRKFKKIFTVSESIEREYVYGNLIKSKIECISNPVSYDKIRSKVTSYDKKYDIAFCGRLTYQKNPLNFVEGIKKIKDIKPDVKAIMIGDGELRDDVAKKILELDLINNIDMIGFVKNPYSYMATAKLFVSTSRFEGYGLVAFEALSLGLPIIVSNVGGLPGIVSKSCGYLYEPETLDWVNNVLEVLPDKKIKKYSSKALERAKELDNIDEYMSIISSSYSKYI